MKVICIGSNCGASHITKELPCYAGCSPVDWTISDVSSINKILAYIYTHEINKVIDRFCTFTTYYNEQIDSIDLKTENPNNYNEDLEIYAPHHVETKGCENLPQYYNYKQNNREKIKRRFVRFTEMIKNSEDKIIFVFSKICNKRKEMTDNEMFEIEKLYNLICLFRRKDTFRIAYIDSMDNSKYKNLLEKYNVDYFVGPYVDEERFWILPCVEMIKKFYNLG